MKKKLFCLRHKGVDTLCNFSFWHSNVFSILKKLTFSLKHLTFCIFKICKKIMKHFFIFLRNCLNISLWSMGHWDKRKTFLCQFCSLKVYLIWWTPLSNTYYHRFHFLTIYASRYDCDKSEMKHNCCNQSLFLNE